MSKRRQADIDLGITAHNVVFASSCPGIETTGCSLMTRDMQQEKATVFRQGETAFLISNAGRAVTNTGAVQELRLRPASVVNSQISA